MAENKMEMDPEVLRTTARKVETSAGDVRKELKRFTSVIEGLSSTWSSEVKDRFLQNYQKDRAALLEMAEQYTEVAEGLLGIADQQPDPCSGKELMLYQTLQGGGIWQEMEPVGSIQRNFCGQCRKSLLSKNPLQRIQMRPMRSFANCRTLMQGRAQMIFTQWPVS